MAVIYQKRKKLVTILLIIIFLALLFNIENLGSYLYPYHHQHVIEKYAAQNGVDPLLLAAIIKQESNFNPGARSPKGARGLMQIMPTTGDWIAQQLGMESFHPDQLYEVEPSIRMGAWYVSHLLKQFNGDLQAALAAYNGGQGNVRKWLAEKDWEENQLQTSEIPFPETRNFVARVMKNYKIYSYLYLEKP